MAKNRDVVVKIVGDDKGLKGSIADAQDEVKKLKQTVKTVAASLGIAKLGKEIIKAGSDFEAQMIWKRCGKKRSRWEKQLFFLQHKRARHFSIWQWQAGKPRK